MAMTFRSRFAPIPLLAVAAALAPALLVAGCGDDDRPSPGPGGGSPSAEFVIQPGSSTAGAMAFVPARDTVQAGQIVRMRNGDTVTHQINTQTAGGPSWGAISGGGFRDQTAANAGTFTFVCTIGGHTMSGVLVVLP
jgi:plastocyanin